MSHRSRTLRSTLTLWLEFALALGLLLLCAGLVLSRRASPGELVVPFLIVAVALGLGARFAARSIVKRVLSPLRGLADDAKTVSPSNLGARFRRLSTDVELRRLESELNAALERMEEAYRAQAQFASNVAHELKSPLAALVTDAQVSRIGGREAEQSLAFMTRAEEELKHLSELVESFLVMARADAGNGRKDLVYVDDVIRRAERQCRVVAENCGVRLLLELPPPNEACDPFVRGDAQLLQAMVENLIRNAIDHSPRGAEVAVQSSCDAEGILIEVRDSGPGIPEELRRRVFERGVRVTSRGRDPGGAGLGLAIVDSVVRLHGGNVEAHQNEGGGCVFVVTLPAARCDAGAVGPRTPKS